MTDWKALCEELLGLWDAQPLPPYESSWASVIARIRAALAESVAAPAEPTDEAAVEAAAELIYVEAMEWAARQPIPSGHINIPTWQQGGNSDAQEVARRTARAVMSRYGHQPAPPAGELLKEAAWLRNECSAENADGNWISMSIDQALDLASLLERQAAPAPAAGEVAELVEWLRSTGEGQPCLSDEGYARLTRTADLLSQRHPAPVPVSERVPGHIEQALIKAECALSDIAEGEPEENENDSDVLLSWAEQRAAAVLARIRPVMRKHGIRTSEWPPLPAHALPLPAGEVQP